MRRIMLGTAASVVLALTMGVATPVSAQVAGPRTAAHLADANAGQEVIKVQRRWRRGWRHRRHWRHRRDHWGPGAAIGLGLGAVIGGLAASAQAQSAIDWCDRRYRSYDRYSRTYLGFDGRRHPCP